MERSIGSRGALQVAAQGLPGLALSAVMAAAATLLARTPLLAEAAVSPLIVAILLGIAAGNLLARPLRHAPHAGFALARGAVLRLAIVLYAFRISPAEMQALGAGAIAVSVVIVCTTLLLAWYAGRRWFGLDDETAILVGAGSSICGAAAVLAADGVIGARAGKVGVAVATVVVFGTCAMLIYPVLVPLLEQAFGLQWDSLARGIYIGATVHEVAQVLVAGAGLGNDVAEAALLTKMMRVCMLAPVLIIIGLLWARRGGGGGTAGRVRVPWFAVAFLALIGIHPLLGLSAQLTGAIAIADDFLLATAMAALGLTVRGETIRAAGTRPLLLALALFGYLVFGGLLVSILLAGY
jgi:uncharacterized integral membrane protein (TIGR00698 family)